MRRYLMGWLAAIALIMPAAALASFSNMFVLGDSLSDNGNLYGWSGAPNPVTFGVPIPVTEIPQLPPPPLTAYSAGRFQNGPSYSELLWSGLQASGHLASTGDLTARGLEPATLGVPAAISTTAPAGTNYAVGGARSRYHSFDVPRTSSGQLAPPAPDPAAFYPFSLRGQFDQFLADFGRVADSNALFVLWSGANDVGDALRSGQGAGQRLDDALDDVKAVLEGLVLAGARYLLVPNVPDLGLIPELNKTGAASAASSLSMAYNASLARILADLQSANADLSLYSFDSFALLGQVAASPASYGFTNEKDACLQDFFVGSPTGGNISVCGNPDEYLFWDANHPSARTHKILSEAMLAAVPEPGSLLLVGLGLVAVSLIGARRRGVMEAPAKAAIVA